MAKISFQNVGFFQTFSIKKCINYALKYLGQPTKMTVYVNFVDKDTIQSLNKNNRGIDAPTDVLSFPFLNLKAGDIINIDDFANDIDFSTGSLLLGEMYICHEIAVAQANEYGHGIKREICFLCLHSLLHLLGYDHVEDEERIRMEELQEKILTDLGITR